MLESLGEADADVIMTKQTIFLYMSASVSLFILAWMIRYDMLGLQPVYVDIRENDADSSNPVDTVAKATAANDTRKIILAWNSFYKSKTFGAKGGFGTAPFRDCPVSNCFFTNNKDRLSKASTCDSCEAYRKRVIPNNCMCSSSESRQGIPTGECSLSGT